MEIKTEKKIPCLVITTETFNPHLNHQQQLDLLQQQEDLLHQKPTSSPRLNPHYPSLRIKPTEERTQNNESPANIKTEGWIWLRVEKKEKKKEWKRRWFQLTVRGLEYGPDNKKKIKGVILFNTIKEVLCSPGFEPHLYQIHIICADTLWQLSLEKDKDAADAWYASLQNWIDPKCFNVPRLVGIDFDDTLKKPFDLQKTNSLRKEFSLAGNEFALFDIKCILQVKESLSGILYGTENFLCFVSKNNTKLKICFNEICSIHFESHHQQSVIILSTKSDKYHLVFKNKFADQIIRIFYLWYHTPTYLSNDDIQKAITIYQEERSKKEELKVVQEKKVQKKEQRERLLKEIGLNSSFKGSRGNLNISKHALSESSSNYIVISKPHTISNNNNNNNNNNNGEHYQKQFIIESEALYNITHNYFPVIIKLDVNTFSILINNNFPYPESLWSTKKLPKKDSVINCIFSYQNISTITIESEYEHILIEFRASEVSIRLCSAYIQLLVNQLYLKNKSIDIKWGVGITPFSYEHPVISKLFFLLKQPDYQYLLSSDTTTSSFQEKDS